MNGGNIQGIASKSVEFTTLVQSNFGGPAQPSEQEITSDAELKAWFGGQLPPHLPAIDWTKEAVLAVGMGLKPTLGFNVTITSIITMTSGFTAPFTFVHYVEHSPTGPAGQVVTQPQHVVKCSRLPSQVIFVPTTPHPNPKPLTVTARP